MTDSATGSLNSVIFWDTKSFLRRRSAQPFPRGCQLASLSWNQTNTKLAVVPKWGDRIAICDFHDDIMTWSFLLHKDGGSFTCGSLLHSSRYLVSGCGNSSVLIWDLKNKNIIKTFLGHTSAVSSVARSSNDHLVVSGSQSGTILMHTVSSSAAQQMVNLTKDQPTKQVVNRLAFSHMEKTHLGSVCDDGVVCLWSVESQRLLAKFAPSHASAATDVCFSPNNNMLMISVGLDAKIKCYDIQTRKTVTEITAPTALSSVALLQDGSTLIGGGTDGKLYVYELRSVKTPREVIDAHHSAVTCIVQQHSTKSSSRKSSSRSSSSSRSRLKEHPSPSKDSSVFPSSPEKPTLKDELESRILSAAPISVQPSTVGRGSESRDHVSREGEAPTISRSSHIQPVAIPESVTPFVTTQHQGLAAGGGGKGEKRKTTGLISQTPYGVSSKHQDKVTDGLPPSMSTPANFHVQTSGIFSPLDPQLVTPVNKVTAAIPPTVRTTPLDTAHTGHAQNVVAQSQILAGGGIFSPLDSGHSGLTSFHQPSATPGGGATPAVHGKLDASLNLSAMAAPPLTSTRFSGQSTQEGQQPTPAHQLEHRRVIGVKPGVKEQEVGGALSDSSSTASTSQPQSVKHSPQMHQQAPPTTHPPLEHLHEEDKSSISSSLPTSESEKHESTPDAQLPPLTRTQQDSTGLASAAAAVTPVPGIQMKFVENLIKDSQEELWYSIHRDIRALSVDVIKQFFAMQQQSAAQFAALNEKVERLSEENKRLQEMVYQYMPKH